MVEMLEIDLSRSASLPARLRLMAAAGGGQLDLTPEGSIALARLIDDGIEARARVEDAWERVQAVLRRSFAVLWLSLALLVLSAGLVLCSVAALVWGWL